MASRRQFATPRRQRGLALVVLLTLFAMGAAYMLVSALNRSTTAVAITRSKSNQAALQQAKAALLSYAATQAQTNSVPGSLPCPDLNNDGYSEGTCSSAQRLGRLPYKTLGIAPLYDASGELLWYGMSRNFRNYSNTVNSDTLGTLSVTFPYITSSAWVMPSAQLTQLVAVVIAPGMRLSTQVRSWTGASCSSTSDPCNTVANYLEGLNGDSNANDYESRPAKLSIDTVDPSGAILFNDQLLPISQADLTSVIEPVVAARIQSDIVAEYIYNSAPGTSTNWADGGGTDKSRYFDAWGGFPFAATFADPSASTYTGVVGTREGLLPLIDSMTFFGSNYYTWTLGSGTVAYVSGSGSISSFNCGATTTAILKCTINSSGFISQPTFRMSGTVANVGRAFVQLPQLAQVSNTGGSIAGTRSLSGSLTGAGAGIVSLTATMPFSFGGTSITVSIRNDNLIDSPLISSTDPVAGWFTTNSWHMDTYYAVSSGYAPGGGGSCTAGVTCLTVSNLTSTATVNDKRAILILAGRSLNGNSRPSGTLGDYLEAQNASTGDRTYEHGVRNVSSASTAINDKVVVVAP